MQGIKEACQLPLYVTDPEIKVPNLQKFLVSFYVQWQNEQ